MVFYWRLLARRRGGCLKYNDARQWRRLYQLSHGSGRITRFRQPGKRLKCIEYMSTASTHNAALTHIQLFGLNLELRGAIGANG